MNDFFIFFHFLRPNWLFLMLPVVLAFVWFIRQHKVNKGWASVVDEKLQPFVLLSPQQQSSRVLKWWVLFALILTVLALAGPAWQKRPQAVYEPQSALVIVLDLSRSMDAADIKPSRLSRAKLKIIDLLSRRKEGQSALVVYAAQSFTVSPLTEDSETIMALLKSLSTDIMPAQGSRMDLALLRANDLIQQTGIPQGHILVVTDGISKSEYNAINKMQKSNNIVSILAVGTEQGAPINMREGGYLKDRSGQIVIAKTNRSDLIAIAGASKGSFVTLRNDDTDIDTLVSLISLNRFEEKNQLSEREFDLWLENGPWLLWLILPVFLMLFRRGVLVALVLLVLPIPEQAMAADWQEWFKNDNQKAAEKFAADQFEQAQQQFKQADWRAAAEYKNKQYEDALNSYTEQQSDDALYNKGNALAKMQQFEEAIKVWDDLLQKNPTHEDAQYNKQQVEDYLKQQSQNKDQQSDQKNNENSDKKDKNKEEDDKDKQQKEQQKKDQQQSKKDDSGSEGDQGEKEQKSEEQQKTDQQKLKEEQQKAEKEQAEKQKEQQAKKDKQEKDIKEAGAEQDQQEEQEPFDEATKQWLRQIPDDPGGLMRNKFLYQYKQLNRQKNEQNPW